MIGKLLTVNEVKELKEGTKVWLEKSESLDYCYDKESKVYKLKNTLFVCDTNKSNCFIYKDGLAIKDGLIKVYEWSEDIKMDMANKNSINKEELLNSVKCGDLVYTEDEADGLIGWRLVISDNRAVSLNTKSKNSWCSNIKKYIIDTIDEKRTIKYVDMSKVNFENKLSEFLHTFDESIIKDFIQEIAYKSEKEEKLETLINDLSNQLTNAKKQLEEIKICK